MLPSAEPVVVLPIYKKHAGDVSEAFYPATQIRQTFEGVTVLYCAAKMVMDCFLFRSIVASEHRRHPSESQFDFNHRDLRARRLGGRHLGRHGRRTGFRQAKYLPRQASTG